MVAADVWRTLACGSCSSRCATLAAEAPALPGWPRRLATWGKEAEPEGFFQWWPDSKAGAACAFPGAHSSSAGSKAGRQATHRIRRWQQCGPAAM